MTTKPTASDLGIDLAAQVWHCSGHGGGAIEIAFARAAGDIDGKTTARVAGDTTRPPADRAEWVLMRVTGDPDERVLVFDRHEWECFLDGARNGEFDDATASPNPTP